MLPDDFLGTSEILMSQLLMHTFLLSCLLHARCFCSAQHTLFVSRAPYPWLLCGYESSTAVQVEQGQSHIRVAFSRALWNFRK